MFKDFMVSLTQTYIRCKQNQNASLAPNPHLLIKLWGDTGLQEAMTGDVPSFTDQETPAT